MFKGFAQALLRLLHTRQHLAVAAVLLGQRGSPRLGHGTGTGLDARGEGVQLGLCGADHAFMQRTRCMGRAAGTSIDAGQERIELRLGGLHQAFMQLARIVRHAAGTGVHTANQVVQLGLGRLRNPFVQGGGLAGHAGQGRLRQGLDGFHGHPRRIRQTVFQRLVNRLGQAGVHALHMVVETVLVAQQTFLQLLVLALHQGHHALQAVHHAGQRLGLLLQGQEGFLTLVGQREDSQVGGNLAVQHLPGLQALAADQSRHQTQHGRCRHARQRGTKRQPQALDGRGQRGTHGRQVGGALQRKHGAVERDHHAQKGAQHAQHHQQTHQVGRQRGAGQAGALAFHAQPHGVLQGRVQRAQPAVQPSAWRWRGESAATPARPPHTLRQ